MADISPWQQVLEMERGTLRNSKRESMCVSISIFSYHIAINCETPDKRVVNVMQYVLVILN